MSKNVELSGILRTIANALRDATAARWRPSSASWACSFPPQDALEARLSALKQADQQLRGTPPPTDLTVLASSRPAWRRRCWLLRRLAAPKLKGWLKAPEVASACAAVSRRPRLAGNGAASWSPNLTPPPPESAPEPLCCWEGSICPSRAARSRCSEPGGVGTARGASITGSGFALGQSLRGRSRLLAHGKNAKGD